MVDVQHHKPLSRNDADLRSRSKRPPLILCIEDNEDSRTMYAAFLTRAGFRVAEARDGQEGLDRTLELKPDLVVLDITLPVLDGKEVLQRIRANEATRLIPVIVVTGEAFPGHWRDAIDSGVEAYLTKPIALGDLLAAVVKVVSMRRAALR